MPLDTGRGSHKIRQSVNQSITQLEKSTKRLVSQSLNQSPKSDSQMISKVSQSSRLFTHQSQFVANISESIRPSPKQVNHQNQSVKSFSQSVSHLIWQSLSHSWQAAVNPVVLIWSWCKISPFDIIVVVYVPSSSGPWMSHRFFLFTLSMFTWACLFES